MLSNTTNPRMVMGRTARAYVQEATTCDRQWEGAFRIFVGLDEYNACSIPFQAAKKQRNASTQTKTLASLFPPPLKFGVGTVLRPERDAWSMVK